MEEHKSTSEEPSTVLTHRVSRSSRLAAEIEDEAALFASPLPITGERKTTTRKEIWVGKCAWVGLTEVVVSLLCREFVRARVQLTTGQLGSRCVELLSFGGLPRLDYSHPGPFNFAISAWQNLLYKAGWDPEFPGRSTPCGVGSTSTSRTKQS